MAHHSILDRDGQKRIKNQRLQELTAGKDAVIPTHAQLVELDSNSFKAFLAKVTI
jgi:hypothetical protein